jgi:hypothetical protein
VTIPFPHDRVLGARAAALLDGEAMAARLGAETCTPQYARYKPETSLLVQYAVDGALAHVWLFADGRATRTWRSASFARLLERARRRHPELPFRARFLDDLGALAEMSPVDSRLPALVRAASPKKLARLLGDDTLRHARTELMRHKPGRKALLRVDSGETRLYVKVHAARVPPIGSLAYVRELNALVYAEAPGERLADLRGTASYAHWITAVPEALAAFHRPAAGDGRDRARLAAAARALDVLVPGAGAARLAAEIESRLDELPARAVLLHGDLYDDQLLVGPEGVVLLDLDEARPGHPLVDVGNFLAHLSANASESLRPAFLDACARAGFDLRGVAAFEAAGLLTLAVGPFRRLEPRWPERVAELVQLAASRLAEDRRLEALTKRVTAGAVLSRALARPVAVSRVDVVRTKHGRRSTLRYRLRDGETVFAKTYASARAERVHTSLRAIAAGTSLRVPAPLGWDRETHLVVTRGLPGRPVRDRVLAGDRALGVEIADFLHSFHSSDVPLERRHALADEVLPLHARAERLAAHAPELADATLRSLALVLAGAELPWTWRWRPVHRDFYEDQLVEGPGGLGVLDLDDAALSEPAVDVANLVAHLQLIGIRSHAPGPQAVSRAFHSRYGALDSELDPRLVSLLVGATLLRLAEIHVMRAGADVARELLLRGDRALRALEDEVD